MAAVIHAEIPDQLAEQARRMVERGWATDMESIVAASLRRHLECTRKQEALTEPFIREDRLRRYRHDLGRSAVKLSEIPEAFVLPQAPESLR